MINYEIIIMLLRVSLLLGFGLTAIWFVRKQAPSLSILIARCLLVAMWIGPLLILLGWSLNLPILPNKTDIATADVEEQASGESSRPVAQVKVPGKHPNFGRNQLSQLEIETSRDELKNPATNPQKSLDEHPEGPEDSEALFSQAQAATNPKSTPSSPQSPASSHPPKTGSVDLAKPVHAVSTTSATTFWSYATTWLAATWLAVAACLLIRFAIRIIRTAMVVRRSERSNNRMSSALQHVSKRLEIKQLPSLRVSNEISGPCTIGWLKPILLFPKNWLESESQLSSAQTEMILAHELTHAKSRDAFWDAFGQLTLAVWWFHPLVTILNRQHRLACEHRCDAAASQIAGDPQSYRRQLARWALAIREAQHPLSSKRHAALVSLSMAQRSLMLKRLSWLKAGQLNEPKSLRKSLTVLLAVAAIGLLCVLVQPAQRAGAAVKQETSGAATAEEKEAPQTGAATGDTTIPNDDHCFIGQKNRFITRKGIKYELDWDKLVTVSCEVKNDKGEPIPGALVQVGSLADLRGNHGSLSLDRGVPADELGKIKIKLPTGTTSFWLDVEAENYVRFNERFKLCEDIEVKMKSGRIVRVRATNENNKLLPDAFPLVERASITHREFEKQADGTQVSPLLPPSRRWMWVVDGSDPDTPILFSDLIDLEDKMTVDEEGFVHPQLKIGTRLEGVLGDEVPRPVKNGFVHVFVRGLEQNAQRGLEWSEHTRIKPDGTFVFESLPRDTHARILVLCDGWQSVSTTREAVEAYAKQHGAPSAQQIEWAFQWDKHRPQQKPQLYHLDSARSPIQIKVPCRQTAALDVRVVDPAGKPIIGAEVSISPNVKLFGDNIIPGWEMYTNNLVRKNGQGNISVVIGPGHDPVISPKPDNFATFASRSYLHVKTDENGLARVRNLPNLSESFEVEANGYVMSAFPTSDPRRPERYALTGKMTPGKVKKMTITMERDRSPVARELTVVGKDGKPIKDMRLTITGIASDAQDPNWQQWSVRRFGETAKGNTDAEGNVRLLFPKKIDDGEVALLAVKIEGVVGELGKQSSANKTLVIPAKPDGLGFKVTWDGLPENGDRYNMAEVEYLDILSTDGASKQEILQNMLTQKSLVTLKQLLAANEYDLAAPLKLNSGINSSGVHKRGNWVNDRFQGGIAIEKIETRSGERVIALATVRPKGAKWKDNPERGNIPEVVFIFDREGTLTAAIGDEANQYYHYRNVQFLNLGGTFDYFVRVHGGESHPPYSESTRWYKVDEPNEPALTVHYQGAVNFSFAVSEGSKSPFSEYGQVGFNKATGKNKSGVQVPQSFVWDRANGKFYGEPSQTLDGKPLYEVVVDQSAKFEPVSAKPGEVTVAGGRSERNWHNWRVVVPDGETLTAKLELRDSDGKTLRLLQENEFSSGQHSMHLIFRNYKPDKDGAVQQGDAEAIASGPQTYLKTTVDTKGDPNGPSAKEYRQALRDSTKEFKIPHFTVDNSPTLEGHTSYFTSRPPLRIFEKRSTDKEQTLVWVIE